MTQGVSMKRTVIAAVAISVLLSPSAVADTKSRAAKNVKVAAIKCGPTKASGHAPKDVSPAQKLPRKLARTFIFKTNCGDIVVTTVGPKAPITITQLATLAKGGYFDYSLCHRLTTQGLYVLQCGDPTATGSGGPNFTYGDENLPTATVNNYPAAPSNAKSSTPRKGSSSKESVVKVSTISHSARNTTTPASTKSRDATSARALAALAGS